MIGGSANGSQPAMVAVDRATAELRRGSFVLVEGHGAPSLAQAAELTTPESLAALGRLGNGSGCVALTASRASALGLPCPGAGVVALPLSEGLGSEAIRWLADPTCDGPSPLGTSPDLRAVAANGPVAAVLPTPIPLRGGGLSSRTLHARPRESGRRATRLGNEERQQWCRLGDSNPRPHHYE